MKITVFTSNGIRHNYLINQLSLIADEVYAIREISNKKNKKDEIMSMYFKHVAESERNIFNDGRKNKNIKVMDIDYGSLSKIDKNFNNEFFNSDIYIVFGSSYIKEPLIDYLIDNNCINLHMGVSPFYRGSACNFWALKDCNYDKIGGTIHYISKGLDSGDIIDLVTLKSGKYDMFEVGMIAVKETIDKLVRLIYNNEIFNIKSYKQDRTKEIKNSKINEFNGQLAEEFLEKYKENKFIEW